MQPFLESDSAGRAEAFVDGLQQFQVGQIGVRAPRTC